ncbi:MAG: flagellar biosynthesis anti-sigma factor FlgM [Planctomycetes bacterium]|nr:flagellar biosynthesis anti-sigma factor FlgM [Planctomycetota bacterium]
MVSSEAATLVSSLHDIPDVRPEVIEEVRRRLSRGEFLSRDAAEKTAEAILADLASFIGR